MAADDRPLAGAAWLHKPGTRAVLAALGGDGTPVRFVGGCVRDTLVGRAASDLDLDLATPLLPDAVMDRLAQAGLRAVPTGLAHGTVTALADGQRFEITTLRRDVATDGRRATVAFTDDFALDAARRDFTMNAMSCDADGRLYDDFGGRRDLEAGIVRFVGDPDRRIAEDRLRLLRFFRFHAGYNRAPTDRAALAACARAAPALATLSGERLRQETLKLLAAPDPGPTLRLMAAHGVLDHLLRAPVALERLERLVAQKGPPGGLLRLAALVRPPPSLPEAAAEIAERLRLSNAEAERLHLLATAEPPTRTGPLTAWRQRLYDLGPPAFADLARLAAAEQGWTVAELAAALTAAAAWDAPVLPVQGRDLIERGLAPGPAVGRILAELERWWRQADFRPERAVCLARAEALIAAAQRGAGGPGLG